MTTLIDLKNTKDRLDKVSPSFCLAKWTQVTLRLSDGHNHSCHHPGMHSASIDEIAKDPSALHNTTFKKQLRQQMIDGKRPVECEYCWVAEDTNDTNIFSDRIKKSHEFWSAPYYDTIVANPMQNINPAYVEVMFNNTCNLKCSYCGPRASSKWAEEIKQYGGYPTYYNFNDFDVSSMVKQRDDNPYIEAFWKWWPDLYKDLKVFRITGGEPLLSKHTFAAMDRIAAEPKEGFHFEINTNLSVPDELIDKMIEKMKKIKAHKVVYTSCEGYEERGEYGRHGLNYKKWRANLEKVLTELQDCEVSIMSAYNLFSVTSYYEFVEDMLKIRHKHKNKIISGNRLHIDVALLRNPYFLSVFILDDSYEKHIAKQVELFETSNFSVTEVNGVKRLLSVFNKRIKEGDTATRGKKDFIKYIDEHDRRRGTDFLTTFPEMEKFYYDCYKA